MGVRSIEENQSLSIFFAPALCQVLHSAWGHGRDHGRRVLWSTQADRQREVRCARREPRLMIMGAIVTILQTRVPGALSSALTCWVLMTPHHVGASMAYFTLQVRKLEPREVV